MKGTAIETTKGVIVVNTAYRVEPRVKSLKEDFTKRTKVKENEEAETHLDKKIMMVYVNYCFITNFGYDKVLQKSSKSRGGS